MDNMENVAFLGSGSYGEVYLLKNLNIVLKEVDKNDEQQKEMGILKKLLHANIVDYLDQPHDFVYPGKKWPLYMEYCEEDSLHKAITDKTLNYSVATIIKWSTEIFTALSYLKSNSIAHRDIKPSNLFLADRFILKIGDFGVFQKFDKDHVLTNKIAGTEIYMTPEILAGVITKENIYQSDVFATGLVIFELITRKNLTSKLSSFDFPKTKSPDVPKLYALIKNCSSVEIQIENRYDVEKALEETKELVECFSQNPLPERARHQKCLMKPEGLCLEETRNSILPPDPTFSTKTTTKTKKKVNNAPKERTKREREDQRLSDLFEKAKRKVNFSNIWIENRTEMTELTVDCFQFRPVNFGTLVNVNEFREKLSLEFESSLEAVKKKNDLHNLLPNMEELREKISKELEEFGIHTNSYKSILGDWNDDVNSKFLKQFAKIVFFDMILQEFCILFALHTLISFNRMSLSWVELIEVFNKAIDNIEEIEHCFTNRKHFPLFYLGDTRDAWCGYGYLVFKDDLTEVRFSTRHVEDIYMKMNGSTIIDLQMIWRFLDKKKRATLKHSIYEAKNTENWEIRFENQLSYWKFGDKATDELLFPSTLDLIIYSLCRARRTRFAGYVFLMNVLPVKHRTAVDGGGFYKTSLKALNRLRLELQKENDPKAIQEYYLELKYNSYSQRHPTQFKPVLSNIRWNWSPRFLIRAECDCTPCCAIQDFPETNSPDNAPRVAYSTCSKLDQLKFLIVHSLFERAFRLLNYWETTNDETELSLLYLASKLLLEIENEPDSGFTFVYVIQKNPHEMVCIECGMKKSSTSPGLLLALGESNTPTYLSHNFQIKTACMQCQYHFRQLTYISLREIGDLIKPLCHGNRRNHEVKVKIKKFWEKRRIEYKRANPTSSKSCKKRFQRFQQERKPKRCTSIRTYCLRYRNYRKNLIREKIFQNLIN